MEDVCGALGASGLDARGVAGLVRATPWLLLLHPDHEVLPPAPPTPPSPTPEPSPAGPSRACGRGVWCGPRAPGPRPGPRLEPP